MSIESRIINDIRHLSRAPRNSRENPEFHLESANWISQRITELGLEVSDQQFKIPSQSPPRSGINIIGKLNGESSRRPILIGAHYDTVPGSPGADDNASGVAAMLECARLLTEAGSDRTVTFVAFDAEELQPPVEGLHGSTTYVDSLNSQNIPSAAIIFESVGFSSKSLRQKLPGSFKFLFRRAYNALKQQNFQADSLLILSRGKGRDISRSLEQTANGTEIGLPILPLEVPWWMPLVRNLRRSDHAPFWKASIPAVMISDTANFRNPHYHQPTDTYDTVDPTLVERAVKTVVGTIESGEI